MKRIFLSILLLFFISNLKSQIKYDTLLHWDLAHYSAETIENLSKDTEHWEYNSKGRYMNKQTSDGQLLKADGKIIKETDGLYIGAGIEAGSLLLRHAMGESQNGLQMQRCVPVSIRGLKAGQIVEITLKSSSSAAQGIASVENLKGAVGSATYPTTYFTTRSFSVISDGNVSWTNSGGVVIKSVCILSEGDNQLPKAEMPVIQVEPFEEQGRRLVRVSLSCATEGAELYYSLVDDEDVTPYAQAYTEPFIVNRSCTLRAVALKSQVLRRSETAVQSIELPLVLPYEEKPWLLAPEKLDRGLIATALSSSGKSYLVNWRLFESDPKDLLYNLYRDGSLVKEGISKTNFTDNQSHTGVVYTLELVSGGEVIERDTALVLAQGYWDIPLDRPADSTTESGRFYYVPGDCMAGDVDGDGQYEIVMKWDPCNEDGINDNEGAGQKDNSIKGHTGNVLIDAYRLDGTKLWRIDLGRNIRAGAHYTQLMVYDLDGDGKAEVACKTAPGTMDGLGKYVLLDNDNPAADYRNDFGSITQGPEYLSVFSGLTGEELATAPYRPARDTLADWGDSYGNRSERYLACVAFLDGVHPSLVMCRGYYTAAFLWAVDFRRTEEGKGLLSTRWLHSSVPGGIGAYGEGAHGLSTADVDGDGRDEIVYGACCIDDDGTLIYRTGLGHGDALHVGNLDPGHPGLEVMMVHESTSAQYGVEMHEALSGKHISGYFSGTDVGRGLCADISPEYDGCEYWSTADGNVYNTAGKNISSSRPSVNFRTYWDGDLQEEITESGTITKWNKGKISTLLNVSSYGAGTNLIKYTPCLQADLFGDWREEQIYYDKNTRRHLMIFSTPYNSDYSIPTLMHDHHYRMATVWQTSAYNQPPHLGYYLPAYVKHLDALESHHQGKQPQGDLVETRYYSLLGQRMEQPGEGVCIRVRTYRDGSRIQDKIIFSEHFHTYATD